MLPTEQCRLTAFVIKIRSNTATTLGHTTGALAYLQLLLPTAPCGYLFYPAFFAIVPKPYSAAMDRFGIGDGSQYSGPSVT